MDKKLLGRWGEERAAEYLKSRGYKIIGLNFGCRFGEIDIIAKNAFYVIFAEVKLRKNASFARAGESVTAAKRRRLMIAADIWLLQNPSELQPRFDVVEIYAPNGAEASSVKINHLENAFGREDL